MADSSAEDLADQLYGRPLDEFTAARNEAAATLRKQGRREEADQVKALAKPSAAAWALNQLARENAKELAGFLKAATALRDAQFGGRGDLKAATARQRAALSELLGAAETVLGESASRENLARIRQSLEAAAVDEQAAARLREGRLVKELEPAGFGSLVASAPARPAGRAAPPRKAKPSRAALDTARRAAERAQQRLERAQRERDRMREALGAAEEAVTEATADAERTAAAFAKIERESR
jgi:hypothetical protein